jgi:hypoxanthine phosphoribosyltransferase
MMKLANQALKREEEIQERVVELGTQISRDYAGRELCVLGVLQGAFVFMSDLVRRICLPVRCGFVEIRASRRSDLMIEIAFTSMIDVTDRDLLLVEDILDTGITMAYLSQQLALRRPRSLRVCTLLDKPERRKIDMVPDYFGFHAPDRFVVGYGLDYDGRYQNLPYLTTLEAEAEGGASA